LSWKASTSSDIANYNVYRTTTSGSCGTTIPAGTPVYASTAGTVTTFTDQTVTNGMTYCYATTAVDGSGESGYSDVAQAKVPAS
jgi:fibronectin type 3 domain-containing protein